MAAGDSAGTEARRLQAIAHLHEAAAREARDAAARYAVAETSERRMGYELSRLSGVGYHLLADRGWPGSRKAQVDMVVVGPGGLFVIDTKAWRAPRVEDGRLFRDQDDVTAEVEALVRLGDTVADDMAEIGLAPGEVRLVIALAGRRGVDGEVLGVRVLGEHDVVPYVAGRGNRLTPRQVDQVLMRALTLFPQVGDPDPVNASVPEPALPEAPAPELPEDLDPPLTDHELEQAALQVVMAQPVEEWMAFLHPAQAKLVRRSFAGPSRIRGPAGTGKTVVALHRAAHLARTLPPERGKVLVTTFVSTLPRVQRSLMARLDPGVLDRVEFCSVHSLAIQLLRERGIAVTVDGVRIGQAFRAAWAQVAKDGPLAGKGLTERYWKDEIGKVIKGRGITRFEDYADLTRTGRQHRLGVDQRRAVWELRLAYDRELAARGVMDFDDIVVRAEQELRREPLVGRYSAVIVDEAQDLSCAMVRMLHGLVGDAPDAFTLVGDGQQAVYPGGYTLAEAGVSVATRGVVLDVNYRNTAEVLDFASRLVAETEFDDIEMGQARGDLPSEVVRSGLPPVVEYLLSPRECEVRMLVRLREVLQEMGTGPGDVAVLCASRWAVGRVEKALRSAGFAVLGLEDYDGTTADAVKVGTIKRAKGLEFKQVLLPYVREALLDDSAAPAGDAASADTAERERWELDRRELFVGATRARDGLWVGVL